MTAKLLLVSLAVFPACLYKTAWHAELDGLRVLIVRVTEVKVCTKLIQLVPSMEILCYRIETEYAH